MKKGRKYKALIAAFALWVLPYPGMAQNAPLTTVSDYTNAVPGQIVSVDVRVSGFNNIGAASLTLDYDYTRIHFLSGSINPGLNGNSSIGDNDMGNGMHRLVFGWYGSGQSIPDSGILVNYSFEYIQGNAILQWFDNGPSCQYGDANANILVDTPMSDYYANGMICGLIPDPGVISGPSTVCPLTDNVLYIVEPVPNVMGYDWTMPPGANIISGSNTNAVLVEYSAVALSGDITVCGIGECGNGLMSILPVTVNPLPLADAGNDTIIPYGTSVQLHAQDAGSGEYSYHWTPESMLIDPDLQDPCTILLTSGVIYTVWVTDITTMCQSSDDVSVGIAGGPLSVNPAATPQAICSGQSSQLFANAGGGSGIYSYNWTCEPPGNPAWSSVLADPVVTPDTLTHYFLTVLDGYGFATGSVTVNVQPLPTAFMEGGGVACDDGTGIPIIIHLSGSPPWNLAYTNGITTFQVEGLTTSPYITFVNESGTYSILSIQDQYCYGSGSGIAIAEILPVPPTPVITLEDSLLYSNSSTGNQWFVDGELIEGATGQFYHPHQSGYYCCVVTISGCASDPSNQIEIRFTGMIKPDELTCNIYPNPAGKFFVIKTNGIRNNPENLIIFNSTGLLIKKFDIPNNLLHFGYSIDIDFLSTGIYYVSIGAGEHRLLKKLVVH